jgi:[ribosomal protein S5]-alanine N-acetyltransferase
MKNENVYLRALEPEDYLVSYKWRNDHELLKWYVDIPRFVSKETERKWVLNAIEEHESGKALRLAICLKTDNRHIGYISLTNIDRQHHSCESNTLIGERDYLRKGYATEARFLMLKFAFFELGMNRIGARVIVANVASMNAMEKFGFVKEGLLRQTVFREGQYYDDCVYSMLREEFVAKYFPETGQ